MPLFLFDLMKTSVLSRWLDRLSRLHLPLTAGATVQSGLIFVAGANQDWLKPADAATCSNWCSRQIVWADLSFESFHPVCKQQGCPILLMPCLPSNPCRCWSPLTILSHCCQGACIKKLGSAENGRLCVATWAPQQLGSSDPTGTATLGKSTCYSFGATWWPCNLSA